MRDGYPLKFFMDLEFDTSSIEENIPKEEKVEEMVNILKEYVTRQWMHDVGSNIPR
jgi:hypothetical protein